MESAEKLVIQKRTTISSLVFIAIITILLSLPLFVPSAQGRVIVGERVNENEYDSYLLSTDSGDSIEIDFVVKSGSRVDVYILSSTQFQNYKDDEYFSPKLTRENVLTVEKTTHIYSSSTYYIIVDNRNNSRSSDALPDGSVTYDLTYDVDGSSGDDLGALWFMGAGFACCAFWIALFVVQIIIAVWVYRDAEERGENGAVWLIVVLIAGIIGLIVYLVVRKDKRPTIIGMPQAYYPQPGSQPFYNQYQQPTYQAPPQQQPSQNYLEQQPSQNYPQQQPQNYPQQQYPQQDPYAQQYQGQSGGAAQQNSAQGYDPYPPMDTPPGYKEVKDKRFDR